MCAAEVRARVSLAGITITVVFIIKKKNLFSFWDLRESKSQANQNGRTFFTFHSENMQHPISFPGLSLTVVPGNEVEDIRECLSLCWLQIVTDWRRNRAFNLDYRDCEEPFSLLCV